MYVFIDTLIILILEIFVRKRGGYTHF